MSEVGFILLSALFLAVPVVIKYAIAFQVRGLLDHVRSQERLVHALSIQLDGLESEKVVVRRALSQVRSQRTQAAVRRQQEEERLQRVRQLAEAAAPRRRMAMSGDAPALAMPVLEEVIDVDEAEVAA
mgnify:CR=1 FL=1